MKNILCKAILTVFICTVSATLHAQTQSELNALITQAQTYLDHSTSDQKAALETALNSAKAATASETATAYTALNNAVEVYVRSAQPTDGTSFDLTFCLANPELTTSNAGWSITPTVNFGEAEIYNQTFDFYQLLDDMPAGTYTLTVTGFYRNSMYYSGIESAPNAGCYLYGNEEASPLLTLYYDTNAAKFSNTTGNYANMMADAQVVFNQNFYADNEVRFTVAEGDEMRVGIRNTGTGNGNWTCFRGFQLRYWGAAGSEKVAHKYRIVCPLYSGVGSVVPGSSAGQQTPVYYSTAAVSGAAGYWLLTEERAGCYSIQSADTKQYITWDGERIEASKRYVTLTDTLAGDSSLWTFTLTDDTHFCIRNVKQPNELFDTRSGSYIVGTYTNGGTAATNQQYLFYNVYGELVTTFDEQSFRRGVSELAINGKTAAFDRTQSLFLFPVPLETMDGSSFGGTIQVTYKAGWTGLTIDGTPVANGAYHTFANVSAGKAYALQITNADGDVANATLTFTGMPVVQIAGSFSAEYSAGTICVNEPDSASASVINARLKWRGATTKYRNKKQYAVKLYDEAGESMDARFFGLRSDNNWILDGMSIDVARMRNRVITDLWEGYATMPYYAAKEPEMVNGTRGQFVEVFLNNSYVGIYCMTEKLDRKQLKLKKYEEETDNIRGELWKSSDWSYSVFMGHNSDNAYYPGTSPVAFNNTSETWDAYEVKYPDLGDGQPIRWDELYNAVNFVCTATDAQFAAQAANYFDLPVLMDYYILMETILSADNHGKNMYFMCYNRNKDTKISFCPWDLDATCGRRWDSSPISPNQDYTNYITHFEHGDYNLFKRIKACNVGDFNDSVRYRYKALRQTALHTDSIVKRFADYKDLFDRSGASAREVARWNNTDAGTLNFDNEMEYITDWFKDRMAYVDEMWDIDNLTNGIASTTVPDALISIGTSGSRIIVDARTATHLTIVNISGQTVRTRNIPAGITEIEGLPKGIYVVNGRKIVLSW